MKKPQFQFTPHPDGHFPIPSEGLKVQINLVNGTLEIGDPACPDAVFPLVENGEPVPQSLFTSGSTSLEFQVGAADFFGAPLFLQEFAVNTGEESIEYLFRVGGGFVGSLDIRDVFREIITIYDFSVVPITISRIGDFIRVTTLRCDSQESAGCWYSQEEI